MKSRDARLTETPNWLGNGLMENDGHRNDYTCDWLNTQV